MNFSSGSVLPPEIYGVMRPDRWNPKLFKRIWKKMRVGERVRHRKNERMRERKKERESDIKKRRKNNGVRKKER